MNTPARSHGNGWLIASAIVLLGLIVAQAGRVGAPSSALAEIAASGGDFAVLAAPGSADDAVVILDQRSEEILLYRPLNQASLSLLSRSSVKELFTTARASTPGRGPAPAPATTPGEPNPSR